ncbi:EexN family lipoprotein [Vreelandella populi]|uniref:EexN family lipoprotein n=1 Tax=Vreelandella populi TaxID=2498858 RepID=UPI000F8ED2C6|nr:EexN family lipoprotein [Halomonas populi]RUR55180.1 hypothetical protein ELY40_06565 [Halomonas populi]
MRKLILFLVVPVVLAACGENTMVQTVDWYKDHDAERKDMIAKCKSSPGELAASPNCINAQQAQNEKDLSRRGYLKLPSVNSNQKGE